MVAGRPRICTRARWVGITASVDRAGTHPLRDMEVPGAGVQDGCHASGGVRLAAVCRTGGCAGSLTGAASDGEAGQLGPRRPRPEAAAPGARAPSLRPSLRGMDAAPRLLRASETDPGELAFRTPRREPRLALGRAPARWPDGPGMARIARSPSAAAAPALPLARSGDGARDDGRPQGHRLGACTSAASRCAGASTPRRRSSTGRAGTRRRSGTSRSPRDRRQAPR